ncbi:MAG: glycine cleavage system transcriptional repressor [Candidatus Dormibacteria bacterium]
MKRHFAIAVMGQDRPGIVAAVTGTLHEIGCNLEDVATSILSGLFAMMMIFTVPDGVTDDEVKRRVAAIAQRERLMTSSWPVEEHAPSARPTHVLTVYGPDRPGIVHAVVSVLADSGVNICDMVCRLHQAEPPTYVLTVEIWIPPRLEAAALARAIGEVGQSLELETSLRGLEEATL